MVVALPLPLERRREGGREANRERLTKEEKSTSLVSSQEAKKKEGQRH
jgi:hypothetical protein